jgi:hypothetical protein
MQARFHHLYYLQKSTEPTEITEEEFKIPIAPPDLGLDFVDCGGEVAKRKCLIQV